MSTPQRTAPDPAKRRESYTAAREYFVPKLEALGIERPYVVTKVKYYDRQIDAEAVRIYDNELLKGDVYFEFTNLQFDLIDPIRTLMVHRYNPNFDQDYTKADKFDVNQSYIIPVTALEVVNLNPPPPKPPVTPEPPDDNWLLGLQETENMQDENMSKMTMRDLYCMLNNVPRSTKPWLNELIEESKHVNTRK